MNLDPVSLAFSQINYLVGVINDSSSLQLFMK